MATAAVFSFGLLTAPGSASADQCTPILSGEPAPLGWVLALSAPCDPYRPVTILYGPLSIPEETGADGRLRLELPVLPGEVSARLGLGTWTADIRPPPGLPDSAFLWIDARPARGPGLLPEIGFPAAGTEALPELLLLSPRDRLSSLDVPVTPEACGRDMGFDLWRDGWPGPRPVRISLPGCGASASVLRLTLPER